MKSSHSSDEICPFSRYKADFVHRRWIYSVRRTDLIEKNPHLSQTNAGSFLPKYDQTVYIRGKLDQKYTNRYGRGYAGCRAHASG